MADLVQTEILQPMREIAERRDGDSANASGVK
jgi:hypothetical protein